MKRFAVVCLTIIAAVSIAAPLEAQCPKMTPTNPQEGAEVTSPVAFEWTADNAASAYFLTIEKEFASAFTVYQEHWVYYGTSEMLELEPYESAFGGQGSYRWKVHASGGPCHGIDTAPVEFIVVEEQTVPPPRIINFDALPRQVRGGESTTLAWTTEYASSVSISGGGGTHSPGGATEVFPVASTTYTLTAVGPGGTATATVAVDVLPAGPRVSAVIDDPIVQAPGFGGGETSVFLQNTGDEQTTLTFDQSGDFFDHSPKSMTLAPGESKFLSITGHARPEGGYKGYLNPRGDGVTSIPLEVNLLSAPVPEEPANLGIDQWRINVLTTPDRNRSGTATVHNKGTRDVHVMATSPDSSLEYPDFYWKVEPGKSIEVDFRISEEQDFELGSRISELRLITRNPPDGGKGLSVRNGATVSTTLVTIVHTTAPEATTAQIPPLEDDEIALLIPGAGHVEGSAGLFFSDISLVNISSGNPLNQIRMFYTPMKEDAQTLTATVSNLSAGTPLPFADVVRTVFDQPSTLGTLQIRAPALDQLSVNSNILLLTKDEKQQTFGNTIPAFRSDRSSGPGEPVFITGLTQTENSHTNLFLQETAGGNVTVDIDFRDSSGAVLGERDGLEVGPFGFKGLFHNPNDPFLPLGSVSAVITSRSGSTGKFAAYATPVDRISGDSWSLVDWNAYQNFAGTEEMVVPVAGALQGSGGLYFRTGFAAVNRGDGPATGILRYIRRPQESSPPIDRTVSLGPGQSLVIEDVTSELFEVDPSQFTLGYLKFLPQTGSMMITSRNFATEGDEPGTYGTGVTTLPASASLSLGEVGRMGGVKDSSLEAIQQKQRGTFRSNLGLLETTGVAPVTVRVTVYFTHRAGTTASFRGNGSKEYTLEPGEFLQVLRVSRDVLGESRDEFGNFNNLQIDYAVVDGEGAAAVYVSSVENNSGDSFLRVE